MAEEFKMDFVAVTTLFNTLSNKAKATLFNNLIANLTPQLCKTVIRYASNRLDKINSGLPLGNQYREQYEKHRARKSSTNRILQS